MLAVVKKPHTDFVVSGMVPDELLHFLQECYGDALTITRQDDNEKYYDVEDMEWYKQEEREETPQSVLKFHRKLRKWTQGEIAEKLHTSKQFISDLECGHKPISRKMAYQLARLFNIDAGRFI